MARRMSFSATTEQIRARTKHVTRRMGWGSVAAGERITAVEKAMGLRKGERHVVLGELLVVDASRVPLAPISQREVDLEGFPGRPPGTFVDLFCKINGCKSDAEVTRIEFRYVLDRLAALAALERHVQATGGELETIMITHTPGGELVPDGPGSWVRGTAPRVARFTEVADVLDGADLIVETGPSSARAWGMVIAAQTRGATRFFGSRWSAPEQRALELELEGTAAA